MAKSQSIFAQAVSDKFTLDLLALERAASHGKTVVLSPLSVSLALGMTMNGSRGKARQATAAALGFGIGRSLRGMNESYSGLRQALEQATDVDLEVANSLVGPSGLNFKKHFLDKSQQFFDARIRLVDYEDPASVVVMNSFICQKTKGKIPAVLDEIESGAELILLNAVYFRGFWAVGFDPLLTQPEQFKLMDGGICDCALMYRQGTFLHHGNLKYQAVKLPYGESGRFAMYIYLPLADGEFGMGRLLQELEDGGLSDSFKRFAPRRGELFLPRFKVEYASTLNASLKQLGVAEVFDDQDYDFGSMAKGVAKPKITLKHKTVVEVDERGGTAASEQKSERDALPMTLLPHTPFRMRADRPFCFFVRDEQTQTISVCGMINRPAARRVGVPV